MNAEQKISTGFWQDHGWKSTGSTSGKQLLRKEPQILAEAWKTCPEATCLLFSWRDALTCPQLPVLEEQGETFSAQRVHGIWEKEAQESTATE